jgi:hypothetical protein
LFALGTLSLSNSVAAAPPLGVYDGNGVLLGTYEGDGGMTIRFATSTGYIAAVMVDDELGDTPSGTIEGVSASADTYNSSDCSGPILSEVPVTGRLVWIHDNSPVEPLGYVAADAAPVVIAAGATVSGYQWGSNQCVARSLSRTTTFVPALMNNPNVTGINGGIVALPIKVAFIDRVFLSGFERLS